MKKWCKKYDKKENKLIKTSEYNKLLNSSLLSSKKVLMYVFWK